MTWTISACDVVPGRRRGWRWLAAVVAVAAIGCFDPRYRAGLPCSERGTCPPDQSCGMDGFCRASGVDVVDASAADGAITDAAVIDGAVIDALIDAVVVDATVDAAVDATVDAAADARPDAAVDAGRDGGDDGPLCNLVPVLSGPDPGVISSGDFGSEYPGWRAFDGTLSLWLSLEGRAPAEIGYRWSEARPTVTQYAIHYANGSITSRAPRDWTLQGLDGDEWTVIDQRTGEASWAGNERRVYRVARPAWFDAYKLVVTDDNDGSAPIVTVSIGRLELLGSCTVDP